jgi:putative hydrolase of the HAD superfamily
MDLGGVFYDLDYSGVWRELSRKSGSTVHQVREALYGGRLLESFESGSMDEYAYWRAVSERLGAGIPFQQFAETWNRLLVKRQEMFDFAARLRDVIAVAIVSNTNPLAARQIARDLRVVSDRLVYSFETGCMKPDRAIYQEALRLMNARADRSLFVDDREENIAAAARLGFHTHQFEGMDRFVQVLRSYGIRADGKSCRET